MSLTDILFFSAEVACFLTALYCLRNDGSRAWRLHRWYLGVVVFVEAGALMIANGFHQSTHWWYNLYLPIECAFIGWFLFRAIRRLKLLSWWWLYGWFAIFVIVYIIDSLSIKAYAYNNNTSQLMRAATVIGGLYYYYLLQRSATYQNLRTFADFWWVNGVVYFNFSITVLHLFLLPQLGDAFVWGIPLFYILSTLLIVILYSTWIYAYCLRYKERKTSPASLLS